MQEQQLRDYCRNAMQAATDMTSRFIVHAERMAGVQARAVREACAGQQEAARALEGATSPQEYFAIQSQIAGAQMEKAMSYWTELCAVGSQSQMDLFAQSNSWMAQARPDR